jgi:nicotinamidase-related amidase
VTRVPRRIGHLLDETAGRFKWRVATQFRNDPRGPFFSLIGWTRLQESPEIDICREVLRPDVLVIPKNYYSVFITQEFRQLLVDQPVTHIYLVGLETDVCVLKNAVDAFEDGLVPIVLTDYCASTHGPEVERSAELQMKRFIGNDQVRPNLLAAADPK